MDKIYILLALFLLFILNAKSSEYGKNDQLPNIVWINCEDVSLNWGCYGDEYATTPNIDNLASKGIVFDKAFATSPICAPARSTLISGVYSTSLGTQHLRSDVKRPDFLKILPEILSKNGYFTTNLAKTDYNFDPTGTWDYWERDEVPWRQRKDNQPFFSMYVYGMTHEGSVNHSEKWAQNTKDLPAELFHNPEKVTLPPYYPNTKEMRKIWAHYHDNNTVFDRVVGAIVDSLKTDGLLENTIILVFSDHGAGLPRYKRWLYDTGIHVPVVAYIPEKFKHLVDTKIGEHTNRIINFADFAPTMLSLAQIEIPDYMEGKPFMGQEIATPRKYTIGTRSRADNMYEMSMAIRTDKYIYIRHYLPHLPYIQPGVIFSSKKESLAEFHLLKTEGKLNDLQMKMYQPKGVEELYDLENDPNELNNLAGNEDFASIMEDLKSELHGWAIEHRSTDFLHEAEYMNLSEKTTPYEFAHSGNFPIGKLVAAAELVGRGTLNDYLELMKDDSPGVRYWGITGLQTLGVRAKNAKNDLIGLLKDESPVVQITAAKTLCDMNILDESLPVLAQNLQDKRPWVILYAARSIELIGADAKPLVPVMLEVWESLKKIPGQKGGHKVYKDFNLAAFAGWSLEMALNHCGTPVEVSF